MTKKKETPASEAPPVVPPDQGPPPDGPIDPMIPADIPIPIPETETVTGFPPPDSEAASEEMPPGVEPTDTVPVPSDQDAQEAGAEMEEQEPALVLTGEPSPGAYGDDAASAARRRAEATEGGASPSGETETPAAQVKVEAPDRAALLREWGVPDPPGGTYEQVYPSPEGGEQNALFAATPRGRFVFYVGIDKEWRPFGSAPGIGVQGVVSPIPPEVQVSVRVARAMGLDPK